MIVSSILLIALETFTRKKNQTQINSNSMFNINLLDKNEESSNNIDYNNNIDCKPVDRLSEHFNDDEKRKILSKNPIRFFKFKERGIK